MKKLLLISVLLGSIILAGCNQKWLSESELFTKKQECAKLKNDIETDIEKARNGDARLDKIFFSPKQNSCLYTMTRSFMTDDSVNMEFYTLVDALSNEAIFSERWCIPEDYCKKSIDDATYSFILKVEEYESILKK